MVVRIFYFQINFG